ncbi:MAG: hypothetical protein RLZZ196_3223 [Bacteroidota bacterium]|jgi:hypothetical protein
MRILSYFNWQIACILFVIPSTIIKAQNIKKTSNTDSNFELLLSEKRKLNNAIALNDRFKIQIFSGESDKAKKTIIQFKQENKDIDATIIFNTPNYKVWVGNFKTRMEAERNYAEIKKKYKNTLLIKPNK